MGDGVIESARETQTDHGLEDYIINSEDRWTPAAAAGPLPQPRLDAGSLIETWGAGTRAGEWHGRVCYVRSTSYPLQVQTLLNNGIGACHHESK